MFIIMNVMRNERIEIHLNPPDPICTETPDAREARLRGSMPTTAEVRAAIRKSVLETTLPTSHWGLGKHANRRRMKAA